MRLLGERQRLACATGLHEHQRLVDEGRSDTLGGLELTAKPLLLLHECHSPRMISRARDDERPIAKRDLEAALVPQLAADPFLFLVELHRAVRIQALLEDPRLVAE